MRNALFQKPVLFLLFFLSSIVLVNSQAFSAEKSKPKNTSKIRITSDGMNAVSKGKYAEFIGNVKAVQGSFTMTSDVLRIYYTEASSKGKNPGKTRNKGSISKIAASGNVHIKSEDFTAVSNIALYLTGPMIIILKGPNAKITSGENSIVGEKIIYYRSDGRIKIEGTPDKRVEGTFYSRENDKGEYSIIPSGKDLEKAASGNGKPIVEKKIDQ